MERLTDEQKNFRDAMQIMIELYYIVKEIDNYVFVPNYGDIPLTPSRKKIIKTWTDLLFIEHVIKLLANLFHKTIPNFSPCKFFSNPPFFHYRLFHEFICFETPKGKSHPFQKLIALMDALHSHCKARSCNICTFIPLEINKVTREYYAHKKSKVRVTRSVYGMVKENNNYRGPHKEIGKHGNEADYPWVYNAVPENNDHKSEAAGKDFFWMNYDDTIGNIHKIKHIRKDVECRIMPKGGSDDYQSETVLKDVNAAPPYYEIFEVRSSSVQGWKDAFPDTNPTKRTVSSPGYLNKETDFFDVIKYILVKYFSLFGSFDRIKVCKNCNRMFLEKKYGYSIYCSDKCRVNFNVASEPKEIIRCRARQNRWLGRKLLTPDTIKKDDCENCQEQKSKLKGGTCPKVQEKNKKALSKK